MDFVVSRRVYLEPAARLWNYRCTCAHGSTNE